MMYDIILQPIAQSNVDQILAYLRERSPQGAVAW
jgi:hypothetical protein